MLWWVITERAFQAKKETAQFLYNIIQTTTEQNDLNWNDFEASLAYISLSEIFDWNLFNEYSDDELENYSRKLLNVELLCDDLFYLIPLITELFQEWIEEDIHMQVLGKDIKTCFDKLINKNSDIFMSFNYTTTLEDLYGINNVFHVHGKIGDNQLIIGHGDDSESNYDYENGDTIDDIKDKTEKRIKGELRKPVNNIIQNNKEFFNRLNDVGKIVVIGWNYNGEVDYPYFDEIIKNTATKEWILTYYDDPDDANKSEQNKWDALLFAHRYNVKHKIIESSKILQ